MSDGTPINPGAGGDTIFDKDNGAGFKVPAGLLLVGTAPPYTTLCSPTAPLPVQLSQGNAAATSANPIFVDPSSADLNSSWVDFVAAASGVVKAAAGTFYELDFVNNTGGASLYLLLFNSSTVPADGNPPSFFFPVPIAVGEKISLRALRAFATGLCWCASTTAATKTIAAGTPFAGSVEFR
jgi:hypothetical protein